jgi:threonine aldolase
MGNQIALRLQTQPGDEVLCHEWAHVRNYEHGSGSWLSGVGFRPAAGEGGRIEESEVTSAAEQPAYHLPRVTLLVWENTHNVSGGRVVPLETMEAGSAAARRAGMRVHLDGARIFNAAAAHGIPASRFADQADTVMFCYSKGLGAPVGSALCGDSGTIAAAREVRKRLGGGMRQAGVIAAAARIALAGRDRIGDDHRRAARLADLLEARMPGSVLGHPETNMVLVGDGGVPGGAASLAAALERRGIRVGWIRPGVLRFCVHSGIDDADLERVDRVAASLGS